MQKTLILLKPDAIERGLTGAILARFERAGLRLENCRFVRADLALLQAHYAELGRANPKIFQDTTGYLQGRAFIAVVLAGPNAIVKVRALTGPTDPCAAPAGTIRGDFGYENLVKANAENRATMNLVHAADSEAAVAREIALWFPQPS